MGNIASESAGVIQHYTVSEIGLVLLVKLILSNGSKTGVSAVGVIGAE